MRPFSFITIVASVLLLAACPNTRNTTQAPDDADIDDAAASSSLAASWGNAPDFSYTTFDGLNRRLSDHLGEPIVVNFWAVWCGFCTDEMPMFEELYRQHAGEFTMLAVAVDRQYDPAGHFRGHGYSYTGAFDVDGVRKYTNGPIPTTAFIDRQGNLVKRHLGGMSRRQFEENLSAILD
jgi:thiol-disulfide isomerase/thioredoxin